ncbi:MAG: hypothetical protein RL660_1944 [Bacteroidota bacterium]|jgi:hypothetical protein
MKASRIGLYSLALATIGISAYTTAAHSNAIGTTVNKAKAAIFGTHPKQEALLTALDKVTAKDYPIDGINLTQDYRQQIIFDKVTKEGTDKLALEGRMKNKKGIQAFTGTMTFETLSVTPFTSDATYFEVKPIDVYGIEGKINLVLANGNVLNGNISTSLPRSAEGFMSNYASVVTTTTETTKDGQVASLSKNATDLSDIDINIYDNSSPYERSVPVKQEYVRKGWQQEWSSGDWYASK